MDDDGFEQLLARLVGAPEILKVRGARPVVGYPQLFRYRDAVYSYDDFKADTLVWHPREPRDKHMHLSGVVQRVLVVAYRNLPPPDECLEVIGQFSRERLSFAEHAVASHDVYHPRCRDIGRVSPFYTEGVSLHIREPATEGLVVSVMGRFRVNKAA